MYWRRLPALVPGSSGGNRQPREQPGVREQHLETELTGRAVPRCDREAGKPERVGLRGDGAGATRKAAVVARPAHDRARVVGHVFRAAERIAEEDLGSAQFPLDPLLRAEDLGHDAVVRLSQDAEKKGWERMRAYTQESLDTLAKNKMTIVKPTPQLMGDMKKIGDEMVWRTA